MDVGSKMDPIATYTERHLDVSRTFALYRDRVEVHAKWLFKGQHRNTIYLTGLDPQPRQMLIRYKWFKRAMWIATVGMLLMAYLVHNNRPNSAWGLVAAILMAAGGVLGLFTYRKVRFVRFVNSQGKPALDIALAGSSRAVFDEFVTHIKKQIRVAS